MKGWRTIAFNVGLAAGTALLQWVAGYEWVTAVGPTAALTIVSTANIVLRLITTTPVGKSG